MMLRRSVLFVASVSAGLACTPTVELDVRGAFMCRNADFYPAIQSVKVQITDPDNRNPALADGSGTTSGGFDALGVSMPGIPAYFDDNGNLDTALQVRWYGSRSSSPDFAAEDLNGYGSSAHIWYTPDQSPTGTVYLPIMEVGTFSPTTDLAASAAGGDPAEICSQMQTRRFGHTATYVPSIGKVLLVGGRTNCSGGEQCVVPPGEDRGITDAATAELYDPATGTYVALPNPPGGGRSFHSATLIGSDTVLVSGGRVFRDTIGNEDVLGTAYLFTTAGFLAWAQDGETRPWSAILNMGPGAEYRRAEHASVAVDNNRAVLVGGVNDIFTGAAYPDLRVDIVAITNTLPSIITFDLNESRDGGSFSGVGVPLQKPRAGTRLVLRNGQMGPEIMVVGGYDSGAAVGAIEVLRNLNGALDQVEVGSFGNLEPAVFGHTATVVADKLVVYGGLTAFPDFSADQRIGCSQRGTNAFCFLEHLRLVIPNEGEAFSELDRVMAEQIQVIPLSLDQANVTQGLRGDEQTELYEKNLVRGRFWHEAVSVSGSAMVVVGGVTRVVQEGRGARITLNNGVDVELCRLEPQTICNLPSRAVSTNERKRFRLHGATSGRAEFRLTKMPGDVLLVSGGRGGSEGINTGHSLQAATGVGQIGVPPFKR